MHYLFLAELIENLVEQIPSPPDRNCSCHISPPCNDCVDHSWTRDLLETAERTRKELLTHQLISCT